MKIKKNFVLTDFICPECTNVLTLPRKIGREKELYHQKKMWCFNCKKEINHIELHNIDIIEKELEFLCERTEEQENIYQLIKSRNKRN